MSMPNRNNHDRNEQIEECFAFSSAKTISGDILKKVKKLGYKKTKQTNCESAGDLHHLHIYYQHAIAVCYVLLVLSRGSGIVLNHWVMESDF